MVGESRAAHREYHVQHVVRYVVRRDSSAIKFDRVEIAFVFDILAEPLFDKEGEETGVPEKTPEDEL